MKMLFIILLIAGGLIYAGNHGAFKHNSVEKSFGVDASDSKKSNQVILNKPTVSSVDRFTKTNASSGTIKDGSEISIVKGEVKSDSSHVQNDESDPYSAHTDVKDLASLPKTDAAKDDLLPVKDEKPQDTSEEPKTLMQQLSQASSLSEVLALLKDIVVPKNQSTGSQQSNSNSQTSTSSNNNSSSQSGNTTIPTSPSDQNPVITPPKVEEVKKDSLVIVLPVDSANTQTNTNGNVLTIKSSSTSNALLSICKTQYSKTKDLRVINQTAAFDLVTKTAQSMTFEVECIQ